MWSSGCDVFDPALERRITPTAASCVSHTACSAALAAPAACVENGRQCVALASQDCQLIGEQTIEDRAIVLGALFSKGSASSRSHQRSMGLAIEHVNAVDGVPAKDGSSRPLVLVACDAEANLERASSHLLEELRVPAILGPDTYETASVLAARSAAAGSILISPTLIASSRDAPRGSAPVWTMVPSDEQRMPLMQRLLGDLELQLRAERARHVLKLGILYREDALGNSVRRSIGALQFNGSALSELASRGASVKEDSFDASQRGQERAVEAQLAFGPDVIVLAADDAAIAEILLPLERGWVGNERPYYLLVESLEPLRPLSAALESSELRARVRGIGAAPSERSASVYDAFRIDYAARYPDDSPPIAGLASSFDATFALAYALAATREQPVSGSSIATGLRQLASGGVELELLPTKVLAAFQQLTEGNTVRLVGAMGSLAWDERGIPESGSLEAWCIAEGPPGPVVQSSGLRYEVTDKRLRGAYSGCAAHAEHADAGSGASGNQADAGGDAGGLDAGVTPPVEQEDAAAPQAADASSASAQPTNSGAVSTDVGLTVQYWSVRPNATDTVITPIVQITNEDAGEGVSLDLLTARYYFSNEQASLCPEYCEVEVFWSGLHPSGDTAGAKARYVALSGAQAYLEIYFNPGAAQLSLGESVEIQMQFHTTPYRELDERDDYSYAPTKSAPSNSHKVTLYRGDTLVWGTPPP
jgi:ABC-type branched-subunit amino acid transport system substrate-binding protein